MKTELQDHISFILEELEVPYSFNEKSEIFTLMIKSDSSAFYVALWYRPGINALNFTAPLSKALSKSQLIDISLNLLEANENIIFGSVGVFNPRENDDEYTIVYNHTVTLERDQETLITAIEFKEYISYLKYYFPLIKEMIGESVGVLYSV